MDKVIVHNQAELNAVPDNFEGLIEIRGGDWYKPIIVDRHWGNSSVVARENSSVVAWENSSVVARENSSVVARENSSVEARENSSVVARENSSVEAWGNSSVEARENSSVEARENSSVEAWENSSVVARENSSVEAWGNSSVVARENSSVEARGNSSVEARENSSVVAWENSSVEARGNSSVVARENSSVEAWENSSVVARENSSVDLNGYAQARVMSERANCKTKGNARLILPLSCIEDYMAYYGIKDNGDTVTMYKAVRKENKYHSDWDPDFVYEIGKTATEKCDTNVLDDCGRGLHVATLDWALRFGCGWNNLAIIECEVPKDKVVVPKFSEGKIRTSELKVIREVPLEEYGVYGKILAKQRNNK